MKEIKDLIQTCNKEPALYNKISNILYKDFNIKGATTSLLVTYFVILYKKGELERKEGTNE